MISAINGFSLYKAPQTMWLPHLAAIESAGIKMVRSDAAWADIEPVPPTPLGHLWQFSQTDAWVLALALDHLTWQPIIDYSTSWAAKGCPTQFCPPDSDAPFAAFAQAVAARYGEHGSFWAQNPTVPYMPVKIFEIWNEENVTTTLVPPARYATLYLAARSAIRSVDQTASVIVGGLGDDSTLASFDRNKDYAAWYVLEMLEAVPGLKGNIDGIGLHPYAANATVSAQWAVDLRYALTVWGLGSVPIDITEVGWMTGDASVEAWRAKQMSALALFVARSNCGIREAAPYTWVNTTSAGDTGDFGFVDNTPATPSLRPAGSAWLGGLAKGANLSSVNACVTGGKPAKPRRHHKKKRHKHRHRHHPRPRPKHGRH